jgi:nucleotide-binding universal stress UspA family protein
LKAEVILLHVIKGSSGYSTPGHFPIMGYAGFVDVSPTILESTEGLVDASIKYLGHIRQHLGDETIQILVEEGDFAETILKCAEEVHADIIVIGSHSQKWLENILMGSVTEKVLQNSSIPLYIIPTKKEQ